MTYKGMELRPVEHRFESVPPVRGIGAFENGREIVYADSTALVKRWIDYLQGDLRRTERPVIPEQLRMEV